MKTKVLGGLFAFLMCILIWSGDGMTANAETYTYRDKQVETAEGTVTVKQWYKGPWDDLEEITGLPDDLSGGWSTWVTLETYPDEETAEWLENLQGDLGGCNLYVNLPETTPVQIGTPDKKLSNFSIDVNRGTATVYGQNIFRASVTNPYSGEVTANLNLYGNVANLILGAQDPRDDYSAIYGTVYVDGDVNSRVLWVKTTQVENKGQTWNNYTGFVGNVTVTGTVAGGSIQETAWDEAALSDVWYDSGIIGNCEAGVFKMENGVLATEVPMETKEPEVGEYTFTYSCHPGGPIGESGNDWRRYGYHKADGSYAFTQVWEQEKVPANSKITVYGVSFPMVFDKDIEEIYIFNSGQHTQKGTPIDVTLTGNVKKLKLDIYRFSPYTVNIEGTVEDAEVLYRYSPTANVNVNGKISNAIHNAIMPEGTVPVGKFVMENMSMITEGIWNPELLFYSLQEEGAIAYAPSNYQEVTTALADDTLDKEVTITTVDGEKTLVKEATVLVEQTNQAVIEQVEQKEEMTTALDELETQLAEKVEKVLSMETVCGVDISVGTHYLDMSTGNSYTGDAGYAAEVITQLEEGNSLPFTVKIPENVYDENKVYTVIREHENTDGTVSMDILETTREGDKISFRSDKFSTFMVVAAEVEEKEPEITFADVKETAWYYPYVMFVCERNVMKGKGNDENGNNIFDPEIAIPREEFVQVLFNASGKPTVSVENKFSDVKDEWYKDAILWANANGISSGKPDGSFGVAEFIQRQDLALMLYKYAALNGYDLTVNSGEIDKYADGNSVNDYAKKAMDWAITNGIMSGKGIKGEDISTFKLDPAGAATRAECATMIMKFMEVYEK